MGEFLIVDGKFTMSEQFFGIWCSMAWVVLVRPTLEFFSNGTKRKTNSSQDKKLDWHGWLRGHFQSKSSHIFHLSITCIKLTIFSRNTKNQKVILSCRSFKFSRNSLMPERVNFVADIKEQFTIRSVFKFMLTANQIKASQSQSELTVWKPISVWSVFTIETRWAIIANERRNWIVRSFGAWNNRKNRIRQKRTDAECNRHNFIYHIILFKSQHIFYTSGSTVVWNDNEDSLSLDWSYWPFG